MPNERAPGWYWVRQADSDWEVAEWTTHGSWPEWELIGSDIGAPDEYFAQIGQRIPDHE